MQIGFGHLVWRKPDESPGYWGAPGDLSGVTDLRPLSQQAVAGKSHGDTGGLCLVASPDKLGSEFVVISDGDPRDAKTNKKMLDAFAAGSGWTPEGDTVPRLIYDLLTRGSNPDGGAGVRPLMPNFSQRLEIYLPGVGKVWDEAFEFGKHSHSNRVRDVERMSYQSAFDANPAGSLHRKFLGMLALKYGVDDTDMFIPAGLPKVKREKPETTWTDNFNRANSTGLGASWTALVNNINVSSNATFRSTAGADNVCRFDSDLSGTDHYGQATVLGSGPGHNDHGPITRKDGTATVTCYVHTVSNGTSSARVQKLVAGTLTLLGSTGITWTSGQVVRGNSNGSTIDVFQDGVSRVSLTDTSITTGLRGGLYSRGTAMMSGGCDDWSAVDLAAPPASTSAPASVIICV